MLCTRVAFQTSKRMGPQQVTTSGSLPRQDWKSLLQNMTTLIPIDSIAWDLAAWESSGPGVAGETGSGVRVPSAQFRQFEAWSPARAWNRQMSLKVFLLVQLFEKLRLPLFVCVSVCVFSGERAPVTAQIQVGIVALQNLTGFEVCGS